MSSAYLFFLLNDEMIAWVQSCGEEVPSHIGEMPAKLPEIADFLQVMDAIPNLRVRQWKSQYTIESIHGDKGRWASLSIFTDRENGICSNVCIEQVGQDQLYNEIVQGIVDICGPLLIYNPSGIFDIRMPTE